jgi:hypothetical protein
MTIESDFIVQSGLFGIVFLTSLEVAEFRVVEAGEEETAGDFWA